MRCYDCPRGCGIDRNTTTGRCHAGPVSRVARAMLHFWEEPCISGRRGSGAIFFSGCNLNCIHCQNYLLQDGSFGKLYDAEALSNLMLQLQAEGAHNINLVTATPHLRTLLPALERAKSHGLNVPVVYNTSAYETIDSLGRLDGLIDIYLPDIKYISPARSARFSDAADYAVFALPALGEMQRQVGGLAVDAEGIAIRGIIVRHLILPGCVDDARAVLDAIAERLPLSTHLSLMRQYTPTPKMAHGPLNRPITDREYERTISYALSLGFHNILQQEKTSANLSYTPSFTEYQ